jgi:hypothetical protein
VFNVKQCGTAIVQFFYNDSAKRYLFTIRKKLFVPKMEEKIFFFFVLEE